MKEKPATHAQINNTRELGEFARAHRKNRSMALKETSELANLGIRFLSEFERGKETAEIGKVLKALATLGLEVIVQTRIYVPDSIADVKAEYVASKSGQLVIPEALQPVSLSNFLDLIRHFRIKKLSLFGSAARGEITAESDLDFLLEFEKGNAPALSGMVRIKDALTELFNGRKIDVATPAILNNPYRRRQIEKDLVILYAA
jgi:predicted nucleotidyltransferase